LYTLSIANALMHIVLAILSF